MLGAIVVASDSFALVPGAIVVASDGFALAPGAIVVASGGFALMPGVFDISAGGIALVLGAARAEDQEQSGDEPNGYGWLIVKRLRREPQTYLQLEKVDALQIWGSPESMPQRPLSLARPRL